MNAVRIRTLAVLAAALPALVLLPSGSSQAAGSGARHLTDDAGLVVFAQLSPTAAAHVAAVLTPSGRTQVRLVVDGFPDTRTFGAHVHKGSCAVNKAGGHYQHVPGQVLDGSEIWLDVTTDELGHGTSTATADWRPVRDAGHPEGAHAVVVHANPTNVVTGAAGPKLGCLDVPFTS